MALGCPGVIVRRSIVDWTGLSLNSFTFGHFCVRLSVDGVSAQRTGHHVVIGRHQPVEAPAVYFATTYLVASGHNQPPNERRRRQMSELDLSEAVRL